MKVLVLVVVFVCLCSGSSLPVLNAPIQNTTVSGLSSGGYMAVQMHIAYSSIISGAGIFAGGPYNCAQGNVDIALYPCMKAKPDPPDVDSSISVTNTRSQSGEIDDISNLADDRVYMFSGTDDTTVRPPVMDALQEYYMNFLSSSSQLTYENTIGAAHTQPTIDTSTNPCSISTSPYISYCDYDGAGEALQTIFGKLNPPNNGTSMGQMLSFDQSVYLPNPSSKSIAKTGYIYVPDTCMNNETCYLHVAFHGCLQSYQSVNDAYITESGYNAWADTNNIIILYPQAQKSFSNPTNPKGCWDWWGYNNNPDTYDTKSGYQMDMVYQMIQHICSGYVSIASPIGLEISSISNTSVSLSWQAVDDATSYGVIRDGIQVADDIPTNSYTDSNLIPGTYYVYQVVSYASSSRSAPSTPISAKTYGSAPDMVAPTDLEITAATSASISISWTSVYGAIAYDIYRNSSLVNQYPSIGSTYTDGGLEDSTYYSYYVTALNSDLAAGPPSTSVVGETDSGFVCQTWTASNYDQVSAGRAYEKLGECYAVGSSDPMGLYNIFTTSTLSETSEDYYIVGSCPN